MVAAELSNLSSESEEGQREDPEVPLIASVCCTDLELGFQVSTSARLSVSDSAPPSTQLSSLHCLMRAFPGFLR